jgi:hypothetical protein
MNTAFELFSNFYGRCSQEDADKILSLLDIKEWWKDNIGVPPDDLATQLKEHRYNSIKMGDELFWCFKTK